MRNKMIFGFIIGLLLIIPIKTNAASVSVALNCPTSANKGDTITCNVNVTSDVLINGIAANYTLNNLTYVSFTPSSGFSTNYSSATGFSIGNTDGKKGTYTAGTIKIKVNGTSSLTIKNLDLSDKSWNAYSPSNKTANIRLKSTVNTLSSLSLSNGTLSPAFNANTTNYTATIDAASTVIGGTLTDSKSKVTGLGTKKLAYGKNTIKVVVTSESGSQKTYTITITRPDKRSNNNNLKTLSANQGNISFNKNTTIYNLNVDSNVSSITINGSVEDTKSSFVKGYGPRTVNLNYGNNAIQVKVQAENTSIKTYTINVNRKDNRSSNNYLKELNLSNGQIIFNKSVLEYNTTVYYNVTKIDVVATPEDTKSKVTVNSPNLNVGNNVITINVTSENMQTRTYKIIVNRLSADQKMSDNNNISSLKVLGHDIEFNTDKLEYDLNIKDEYALVFEINLEDPKASYKIEGNEELKDGSVIKVISTSESGQTKEYKFNVSKEIKEEKANNNIMINVVFAIGGFLVGVVITLILTKKKKNNVNSNINMNNNNQLFQ